MRPGFWHKCRVGFRWLRISLWLLLLAGLCTLIWFNQIGLPGFLKTRLVAALHERGINLEFSRMRLRFPRGLVAENVRISSAANGAGPVLMLDEFQMPLDFHSLWLGHVRVNALSMRGGKLIWPLSPTNQLQLENIQTRLRFQTNDTWSLGQFSADFAGVKLNLSGDISHASALQTWKMFHSSSATNLSSWQSQLQKISSTLDRIHFSGMPELNLTVRGDARDLHSFLLRLDLFAPVVKSPWLDVSNLQFNACLTMPADAPVNSIVEGSFWTNLQPYQLAWSARAMQLKSKKLDTAAVAVGGFWHGPELTVTNLSVVLPGGQLELNAKLNVVTRELSFTNSSCFEVHALDALLTGKLRKWAAEVLWSQPPSWQIGGGLILPDWTNVTPDWLDEVAPTLNLTGHFSGTNIIVHGATIDTTRVVFNYAKQIWNFSNVLMVQGKTHLEMSGNEDDATKKFACHISGAVDLESARPFLTTNAARVFEIVKLPEPLVLNLETAGRVFDWKKFSADGRLAVTNFTIRGQPFSEVATGINYTNQALTFIQPKVRNGARTGTADSITLDFNSWLIYFTNILSALNPEPVVRAIGPKTWKLVEPYRFLSPPTVRVNGQIPLGDLHGGPEMAAVDMWFDIIKGAPFEWLKLKTTNIVGRLHWRGQTLLLTNAVAAFYGGTAEGFADFDFRVPHPGGDYHFRVNVTEVNLHSLATDLSSPTNSLEGTLAGQLTVTNASTEDLESWRGFGQINLQNGLLWNIPIIMILSPVLNTVSPGLGNLRATGASGKFGIANGVMSTDSLEIHSTMTRLEYVGTIDLQRNVNARVTAHLLRDTWVVGPLVSTALWPVSKIFEYRITGPLQNPKSEPLYVLPKLLLFPLHPIRSLENIFTPGSDSYTNRPSWNRN